MASFLRLGLIIAALGVATAGAVRADELSRLNSLIVRDPSNIQLNLQYARLAERQNELKWALAAYERILVNDPTNIEAREGIARVRNKLQPNNTQFIVEIGSAWESNPFYLPTGARGELQWFGRFLARDQRHLGDVLWRTVATGTVDIHRDNSVLNYGYAGVMTGPVLDLPGGVVALHPAFGVGGSYFDHRMYYREVIASLTFEGYLEGASRNVRLRIAHRDYNDVFPSTRGFYGDIVTRFAWQNVITDSDIFVLAPWLRISAIGGVGINVNFEDVQVGRYREVGTSIAYYRRLLEWLTVAVDFLIYQRTYAESFDPVTGIVTNRRDVMISPGVIVILHDLVVPQGDLRFDYHYQDNDSTDPLRPFVNHLVTVSSIIRF